MAQNTQKQSRENHIFNACNRNMLKSKKMYQKLTFTYEAL